MLYEINVSRYGQHLFATHERSIIDIDEFQKVLSIFKDKFPKSEGYNISATKKETSMYVLNID